MNTWTVTQLGYGGQKKISAARAFRQSETTSSMSNAQQSQQHTSEFFGCATFTILTHKIYNMGDKLWLHE